jgi:diguanylate cyclase (GGDEF)-like protein
VPLHPDADPDRTLSRSATSVSDWSVRTFVIWLVVACLLPGVIGAIVLFIYQYTESRAQLEKNMVSTSRALVQATDNHLLRLQAVVQALATSDALARHDFAQFHQQARETVAKVGLGNNVVLRDQAGWQLLNTAVDFGHPLSSQPAPEQVREVFATAKPVISNLFIGPVLKQPVMSVDVPVFIDGKVAYALGVGVLPQHFNAILKAQHLPADWVGAMLDRSGTVVGRTHQPDKYVGHLASANLLKPMRENREGSGEATTLEGIPVVSFFSRSPVTNWSVAIGVPRQAVVGALVRTLAVIAIGIAALFAIALVMARFIGRKIAYSIQALTAPASALGEGIAAPVPALHVKEAAEVALAISRAADLLQERAASLQAKDAELEEAHRLAKFGSWYWDLTSDAIKSSDSLRKIIGNDVSSFPAMRGIVIPEQSWQQMKAAAQQAVQTGNGYEMELAVNHADGHTIWIHSKCEAIRNHAGKVAALRGTVQDITERKLTDDQLRQSEAKLRDAALHDALTGLPNRALVFEYCDHLLAAAQRSHGSGALLFIDLDRFKPINDLYGHETGDRVLQEVGQRLLGCTRHEDLVGRLGGDEFVIVLPYLDADRHRAAVVARHVVDSISRPFRINALELSLSPSIGISYFPEHATDVSTLLHTADLAMYQAKQAGRANYQFYNPELDQRAGQILSLELRLKNALRHGGLRLLYQPVIDIKSGRLTGAEALVRLADNDGDAIGPDRFIPVAESVGLIGELGEWVAAEACRQHQAWLSQGLALTIAINVSPLQFRQRAFADKLSAIITDSGIDPACLEIEVTESTIMESVDEAVEILNRIKSLGVKIALDDFGTGYSSLARLSSLPLDKLKVDRSFVQRIERDQASRAVTDTIIALGRSLRLDVVGEGIESEYALRYLEQHGCNQAQGYWFSRPLPALEFGQWQRQQPLPHQAIAAGRMR